ncbi:unnamed protein product [Rotaria sordida]|uniref:Uncharacterized protein n=1 Tax=Rotaria sordida TaxID=392033 RepID=A0A814P7G7_9BILA|nr:unnamed protein product [Rotaria sordida]CAF1103877.1 unnamed protein product [Rotaria sordida]
MINTLDPDNQHRQLIICNVQIENENEYYVQIHNDFGEVTSSKTFMFNYDISLSNFIFFKIQSSFQIPSITIDDIILQCDDEFEYQFEIEDRSQVDITWLRVGCCRM